MLCSILRKLRMRHTIEACVACVASLSNTKEEAVSRQPLFHCNLDTMHVVHQGCCEIAGFCDTFDTMREAHQRYRKNSLLHISLPNNKIISRA